ncbi:MAG: hypothetical protein J6M33_03095 [Anaerovibrio sp.]|nr:hypothetical protein [Anaerovibrio sp.]
MWNFEEYIKDHKIALLGVGNILANEYDNIDFYPLYRLLTGYIEKRRFKIYEHLPNGLKKYTNRGQWYDRWQDFIEAYDVVIIGNDLRGRDLIEYLQERNPKAKIIVYYESIIGRKNRKHPARYKGINNLEFVTFDKGESEELDIRYVQFYYDPMYFDANSPSVSEWIRLKGNFDIKQDVFFVGRSYDRIGKLVDIHSFFEATGIKDKMVIMKSPHHLYQPKYQKYMTDKRMAYSDVIREIFQSKCVLEVLREGQRSMSYRPIEAVVWGKKLITNNIYAAEYDMYSQSNVFILGVDDNSRIKEFIDTPLEPYPKELVEKYSPQNWLETLLFYNGG